MKTGDSVLREINRNLESHEKYVLPENTGFQFLRSLGFDVPKTVFVSRNDIEKHIIPDMRDFGDKVVIKIVSEQIPHKTEYGGVKVIEKGKLHDESAAMLKRVSSKLPNAGIDGILIQDFVRIKLELLASLVHDDSFGHFLTVGLGGIYTELFRDISIRMLPVSSEEIMKMLKELRGSGLIFGYREQKGIDTKNLMEFLSRLSGLAGSQQFCISELEFNPLAISEDGTPVIIDAHLEFARKKEQRPRRSGSLNKFFEPDSIAVIGASSTPGKLGYALYKNLLSTAIRNIYPVNPKHTEMLGRRCYPSLNDISDKVDLAVVAVSAPLCPAVMKEIGKKRIPACIVISSGFKETGEKGAELEKELHRAILSTGTRVIGPNCMGVYSSNRNFHTFFFPEERFPFPDMGPKNVAIVTQSGSLGAMLVKLLPDVGIMAFVSYGNMVDVTEAEILEHFINDSGTAVVIFYIEGLSSGREFCRVASVSPKPVVVLKGGKSEEGSRATRTHTGSMAGDYQRTSVAFRQSSVIEVKTLRELLDVVKAFSYLDQKKVTGSDVGILTNMGGVGVLATDTIAASSLKLSQFSPETRKQLSSYLPDYAVISNPLDLGGGATDEQYLSTLKVFLDEPKISSVMVTFGLETAALDEKTFPHRLISVVKGSEKPVVLTFVDFRGRNYAKLFEENDIPCYPTPEQAIHGLGEFVSWRMKRMRC